MTTEERVFLSIPLVLLPFCAGVIIGSCGQRQEAKDCYAGMAASKTTAESLAVVVDESPCKTYLEAARERRTK